MLVQMNMDFIFVPESAALRCLSFLDVKGTNFVPKKEICGGRKISKEQRYIISLGKKIFFEKYPLCTLISFCRPVRYTYHRGEFVKDDGKVFFH